MATQIMPFAIFRDDGTATERWRLFVSKMLFTDKAVLITDKAVLGKIHFIGEPTECFSHRSRLYPAIAAWRSRTSRVNLWQQHERAGGSESCMETFLDCTIRCGHELYVVLNFNTLKGDPGALLNHLRNDFNSLCCRTRPSNQLLQLNRQ